jgi:hypothetical protein
MMRETYVGLSGNNGGRVEWRVGDVGLDVGKVLLVAMGTLVRADRPDLRIRRDKRGEWKEGERNENAPSPTCPWTR